MLVKINLKKANLKEANLQGAWLVKAELIEANLEATNLNDANLRDANLAGANLNKSQLYNAILEQVNFCGTIMENGSVSIKGCSVKKINGFPSISHRKHYPINRYFN